MDPLTVVVLAFVAGGLSAAGVVWLVMTVGQLRARVADQSERITELERARSTATVITEPRTLDHRAQLLSVAALVKLSARDQLDALMRLSPDMVRELLREEFPWLFDGNKEIIG